MENKFDNLFAFVLGREQKIARAELESVLRHFYFYFDKNNPELNRRMDFSILSLTGNVILINIERGEDFLKSDIMSVLGGTMEIYQIIAMADSLDPDIIYSQISHLSEGFSHRVTFGISDYSKTFTEAKINTLGLDVKKKLKKNISARFVAERGDTHLSSAAIISNRLHKDGLLLGIFSHNNQYLIGKLIGATNPNEWSKRDFGKPKSDRFAGMCPPKLARMIINLALGSTKMSKFKVQNPNQVQSSKSKKEFDIWNLDFGIPQHEVLVVDPFCGSGNILIEALALGCEVIGSDVSEKAVDNTKANLNWLNNELGIMNNGSKNLNHDSLFDIHNSIFQADATKFDFTKKLEANKSRCDGADRDPDISESSGLRSYVIVTEPYLGQPKKFKPTLNAVKGEYSKVKRLYVEFLKNVSGIKYQVSCIGIVFPLVETVEGKQFSLFSECIDEIKEIGYTLMCEPFVYGRDYQVVKRQIAFFKQQDTSDNNQT